MIWLDLANAYGSVPHAMFEEGMKFFWFPKELRKMIMEHCNRFKTRFTAGNFTIEWQRLEVGLFAGCAISVVLLGLVIDMISQ